mmetsp:Transcript_15805/g.31176  ORF Transcript_15805/g.31176 Transcript_15805/m.31176 type:complete len:289 (-) Transcript_15805:109-975(-)
MRLPFTVVHADSEARDSPASNLHNPTVHSPGWASAPFPLYPQEITLAFTGAVSMQTLRILSHELFVSSKVHISIGRVKKYSVPHPKSAKFKYLGFVRFANNGEWRMREQQTIPLNGVSGSFLRLTIEKPHSHAKNLCGQVGLVDIVVEGDVDLDESTKLLKVGREGLDFQMLTHGIDLEEDFVHAHAQVEGMGVDAVRMVRRVAMLKQDAQGAEDYDEAERLSGIEMEMARAGRRLEDTEAQKQDAVAHEDYARAKALKITTDELKGRLKELMESVPLRHRVDHHRVR